MALKIYILGRGRGGEGIALHIGNCERRVKGQGVVGLILVYRLRAGYEDLTIE